MDQVTIKEQILHHFMEDLKKLTSYVRSVFECLQQFGMDILQRIYSNLSKLLKKVYM